MDDEQKTKSEAAQELPAHHPGAAGHHQMSTEPPHPAHRRSRWQHWRELYVAHKKWSIPLTVLAAILFFLAIPWTRYPLASAIGLSHSLSLQVLDQESHTAVSGATVSAGSISAMTDAQGQALLKGVKVGHRSFMISKKFYNSASVSELVPLLSQGGKPVVYLKANGRQVKVVITNKISKQPAANVTISFSETQAQTDSKGTATLVVPAGQVQQAVKLSGSGYNSQQVTLSASDTEIKTNNLTVTPAGKLYFLSKLSGKIDVVKTDLDGANRQMVIAGTGQEDDRNTVLLAARDWKYLALLAKRDSDQPKLYLIETGSDKLSVIDEGSVSFNLAGWSGDSFVYFVDRGYGPTTPHGQALKAFNAVTRQLSTVDQTDATGNNSDYWGHEYYSGQQIYLVASSVVYVKQWSSYQGPFAGYQPYLLAGKQAVLNQVNTDGSGGHTLKSFSYDSDHGIFLNSLPDKAQGVYLQETDSAGHHSYFAYENGKLSSQGDLGNKFNDYSANLLTYLLSPSNQASFWSEPRDGKNTLLIGDGDGNNGRQVATLSDYQTYGWFSDNYLLVSKNGSQLFILPTSGIQKDDQALKVTDYHKPAQTFPGYGGGYGGI